MQNADYFNVLYKKKRYNFEKLSSKHIELIEIAHKFAFYKKDAPGI